VNGTTMAARTRDAGGDGATVAPLAGACVRPEPRTAPSSDTVVVPFWDPELVRTAQWSAGEVAARHFLFALVHTDTTATRGSDDHPRRPERQRRPRVVTRLDPPARRRAFLPLYGGSLPRYGGGDGVEETRVGPLPSILPFLSFLLGLGFRFLFLDPRLGLGF